MTTRKRAPKDDGTRERAAAFVTDSIITPAHRRDHYLARWGVNRSGHRVEPGLYALGEPGPDSPVFVTANYTLSFDALREALTGMRAWILVLDTHGINVWCAAGKGTFGTGELVRRIAETGLHKAVRTRTLILPQLAAPGVAAADVTRATGFTVEFGPVRTGDLKAYLDAGRVASPEMRRITFTLPERMVVIPVELVQALPWMMAGAAVFGLVGGWAAALAAVVAVLGGAVLFPILLPWLPTPDFTTRGWLLGGALAVPFALRALFHAAPDPLWYRLAGAVTALLAMPPVTAYLALNFTGSTTFTSMTGVRREIVRYIPSLAWTFAGGVILGLAATIAKLLWGGL